MAKSWFMPLLLLSCLILLIRDEHQKLPWSSSKQKPSFVGETPSSTSDDRILTVTPILQESRSSEFNDASRQAEDAIRKLFREGRFAETLKLARTQLDATNLEEPYKQWLREQIPILRIGLAWQFVRSGRCEEADSILSSLSQGPQRALALKGLGYCAIRNQRWNDAEDVLKQYITLKPKDPDAYLLLAETLEALGFKEEALTTTQKAQDLSMLSDDEAREFQDRESRLNSKLQESPSQVSMSLGHFSFAYQNDLSISLIQSAAEILEQSLSKLVGQLGFEYPSATIEVVFHKPDFYQSSSGAPYWSSGVYDGRIRIPISSEQNLDEGFKRVLRHELTHALLSLQSRNQSLPYWFQEGLAQISECAEFCFNYRFAATSYPFQPAEVFAKNFTKLGKSEAQVAYNQSLYLMIVLSRYFGISGIRQIIQGLPNLDSYDSDQILGQVQLNFQTLHNAATKYWDSQQSF